MTSYYAHKSQQAWFWLHTKKYQKCFDIFPLDHNFHPVAIFTQPLLAKDNIYIYHVNSIFLFLCFNSLHSRNQWARALMSCSSLLDLHQRLWMQHQRLWWSQSLFRSSYTQLPPISPPEETPQRLCQCPQCGSSPSRSRTLLQSMSPFRHLKVGHTRTCSHLIYCFMTH